MTLVASAWPECRRCVVAPYNGSMRCAVACGLVVFVAVTIRAEDVRACSCTADAPRVVPIDGSVDVVRDAKIWVPLGNRYEIEDLTIVDEDRRLAVEGTWSTIVDNVLGDNELAVFHPGRALRANTTYGVEASFVRLGAFTTGERFTVGTPTISSPRVDSIFVDVGGSSGECRRNSEHFVSVTVSAEHDGAFLLVDVDGVSSLNIAALDGLVVNIAAGNSIGFGSSLCAGPWPRAAPGASGLARVGSLDIAGLFSGWSEEVVVDVPLLPDADEPKDDAPTSCASAPPIGSLIALCVALCVRRRQRRSAK